MSDGPTETGETRLREASFYDLPWHVEERSFQSLPVISDADGCDRARVFDTDIGEAICRAVNEYASLHAEVERLRLALEQIASARYIGGRDATKEIARAALDGAK